MNRIISLFILSLLMVGARAASPFVDFSKYRNLEGVRYVYLPGSMARQVRLTSDMEGFTPTTFSEVDGILMLLPSKDEVTNSLLATVTNIANNKFYQTHYVSTNGPQSTTLLLHPMKGLTDTFDEMIFFSNENKKVLLQLMGKLHLTEVQEFLNSYIAASSKKKRYTSSFVTTSPSGTMFRDLEGLEGMGSFLGTDSLQIQQWAKDFPLDSLQLEKLTNQGVLTDKEIESMENSLRKWAEQMPRSLKKIEEGKEKILRWAEELKAAVERRKKEVESK
ncbi:MAG: DUF4252 domain-containing protein [Alloprevotella sp.]